MNFVLGSAASSSSSRDTEAATKAVDTAKVISQVLLNASGSDPSNTKKVLVGAIDQGTSSTRFLLFTKEGKIAAWAQKETTQIFPTSEEGTVGWHEHDPFEIWRTVVDCIRAVISILEKEIKHYNGRLISGYEIASIGITNQRETTVAWNSETGKIYHNAIVWDDTRTVSIAKAIADGDDDRLRNQTGLPLASYFAGTKVRWLLDNVPALREDLDTKPETVRFGTIDTWIVYQLTGAPPPASGSDAKEDGNAQKVANVGGLFVTDASNASRWLFLDIATAKWDPTLIKTVCGDHDVPLTALPTVKASSEVYATLRKNSTGIGKLEGVPVAAILGDQQAALFGQVALEPGEAKNTYGTGMFLMMNTGKQPVPSNHGLLTTVAYRIGDEVTYALEGSVSHSGSTIQWLRDQLEIIAEASESESIASDSNDGLYMVPAFAGLFAPHWRPDARGCVVGITAAHHKGHFARAALEAAAYQCRELFEAIVADSGVTLKALKVDGGGSRNKLLMQFQADLIDAPVVVPKVRETTAMGAAFAAGLAVGIWKDPSELRDLWEESAKFVPAMDPGLREKNLAGWKKAVQRSLDWVDVDADGESESNNDSSDTDTDTSESKSPVTDINANLGGILAFAAVLGGAVGYALGRMQRR